MFSPPEMVDVAHESFVGAGLVEGTHSRGFAQPPRLTPQGAGLPADTFPGLNSVGTLAPQQLANAQLLLDATPPRLRAAAHHPAGACILLCGLLLDRDSGIRARQRQIVAGRMGSEALLQLDEIESDLVRLQPEHKLPLLQLALPALRTLSPGTLASFFDTLDDLVHADAQVSVFEFTLQKLLIHTLKLGRSPGGAGSRIHSFQAVDGEISVVLSALAHAATSDPTFARAAFTAGVVDLKMIESGLAFLAEAKGNFVSLDRALDRLAMTSPAIKQRVLLAASHVVSADGRVLITEFELLRAIAAALDCPMPPMASSF
jgi:hypothetical protein